VVGSDRGARCRGAVRILDGSSCEPAVSNRDANLSVLLAELGVPPGRRQTAAGALLIAVFELSFIGLAVAQSVAEYVLGLSPVAVVAGVWIVWTGWHSWIFPRNRRRYLEREHSYRTAFARDIYPWVTVGFCQMWRPLFNGDTVARLLPGPLDFMRTLSPIGIAAAIALSSVALVTMISAIRSIGIANAAFVPEFRDAGGFVPVERGIYARFMHPLFWSGILFSIALALAIATPTAVAIAAINLLYGLVYGPLESRRLEQVFGRSYSIYASRVASLPGPAAFRKPLASGASARDVAHENPSGVTSRASIRRP